MHQPSRPEAGQHARAHRDATAHRHTDSPHQRAAHQQQQERRPDGALQQHQASTPVHGSLPHHDRSTSQSHRSRKDQSPQDQQRAMPTTPAPQLPAAMAGQKHHPLVETRQEQWAQNLWSCGHGRRIARPRVVALPPTGTLTPRIDPVEERCCPSLNAQAEADQEQNARLWQLSTSRSTPRVTLKRWPCFHEPGSTWKKRGRHPLGGTGAAATALDWGESLAPLSRSCFGRR